MMAQNDLVVAGIDVAKDKVDVCIRSLSLKRTFAGTEEGRRELTSWLRRRKVGKAVMEARGGFNRALAQRALNPLVQGRVALTHADRNLAQTSGRDRYNDTPDPDLHTPVAPDPG